MLYLRLSSHHDKPPCLIVYDMQWLMLPVSHAIGASHLPLRKRTHLCKRKKHSSRKKGSSSFGSAVSSFLWGPSTLASQLLPSTSRLHASSFISGVCCHRRVQPVSWG